MIRRAPTAVERTCLTRLANALLVRPLPRLRLGRAEAAAEWARAATTCPGLDLSDGYSVAIVLGAVFNANQAAEFPDGSLEGLPALTNFARTLGLVLAA